MPLRSHRRAVLKYGFANDKQPCSGSLRFILTVLDASSFGTGTASGRFAEADEEPDLNRFGASNMTIAMAEMSPDISPPEKLAVTLVINGVERRLDVAPWTSLLDLLREQLNLTGSKKGCDRGNAAHARCM